MAVITPQQIAGYAYQAGFRGNSLNVSVAVALAESGGNTTAVNHNTNGSTDYGLWQINSVHSQYSPTLLLSNPAYNAGAAWDISSHGANWNPWTTFANGTYFKYMAQATNANNAQPAGGAAAPGPAPWYTFSRIDNLGGVEPFGGFPKPDSNIQIPTDYPVTALLPGTVTGIDTHSDWGASVTILLDRPLNQLATHTAYLHLRCDVQVRVGQHVSAGDLIAYNGLAHACGAQKVPLGFALYNGDMYGSDPAWAYMTKANLNGGPLDPVPLLNAAKAGSLGNISGGFFGGLGGPYVPLTYTTLTSQVHQTLINTPGFYGIALAVDEAEQFPGWVNLAEGITDFQGIARSIGATISDNFIPFAIRSGLVAIGMTLLGLLATGPIMSVVKGFI
jgi:murein DD-endopeptidase MepM/ murein hydrolase activator NlpD